ncbi:SET and MYND domain-containing protein DDB_G0273589-like [Bradysia coprophila]|uniref:SET and MYND domain-containing protein DDB_G0273589-like n=1 Tax=Bradysia coprophila TaxID=38358 RepID=UPI00187DCC1C|nr:SET and MYND domain-containing protein DDB_G0273589-like [Bradysia coprophila]
MCSQLRQLWVKEDGPDPSYVDLFDDFRSTLIFRENILEQINVDEVQKDDNLAEQYRQCGNRCTDKNDFKAAIEHYNKSVCFAENQMVASFAFANRAFCFLKLEMYDECLSDIEIAVRAKYPTNLMPKLVRRRETCLNRMASSKRTPFEPQLSFPADDRARSMANVLALRRNQQFGRHLVAKCDIEEDQIVIIEEALVTLVDDNNKYKRCSTCLKEYTSTIPCGNCTKVLFCRRCMNSVDLHQYECSMKHLKLFVGRTGNVTANCVKFVIRTIVRALEVFSSADSLMEFDELLRKDHNANHLILSDGSFEAVLGIFLTLHHLVPYETGQIKIMIISCIVYDSIINHSELKTHFLTQKLQRFLMHLVTQLTSMFTANNILLQDWSDKLTDLIDHNSMETFGVGLFNISSYINHACMPNVVRLTVTGHTVIKTLRPIKQGEQLFVRYAIDPNWTTSQRQQQLLNICGFQCTCKMCLSNGPLKSEVSVITEELADLTVELSPLILLRVKDTHRWTALKEKLFQFTKKYENLPVSKSIILSYEYIKMILMRELSSCAAQF